VTALRETIVLLELLFLLLLLAPDRQRAIRQHDLDVLLVNPRHGGDLILFVFLRDIEGRRDAPVRLPPPRQLDL
jgi:hypothetical protein